MYTLEQVKAEIAGKEPFDGGNEGSVYALSDTLVAKVRHSVRITPDRYIIDNLGEERRKAVHTATNHVLAESRAFCVGWHVRLVTIDQVFVDGHESISIMPRIGGTNELIDPREFMEDTPPTSEQLDQFLTSHGVEMEKYGHNIRYGKGTVTVFEAGRFIHPEMLARAEKATTIAHLARAYLLDSASIYPAVLAKAHQSRFSWDTYVFDEHHEHKLYILAQHPPEDIAQICAAEAELRRIKALLGAQFNPEPFDWEQGTNSTNYGIKEEVFATFQDEMARQQPAVEKLKASAAAQME